MKAINKRLNNHIYERSRIVGINWWFGIEFENDENDLFDWYLDNLSYGLDYLVHGMI